ncbi:MAG: hypothetical protein ISS54_07375 [Dehalococcoidia bacterium]|nr:hypothetical protein [Dehalococcoidia bacterium]
MDYESLLHGIAWTKSKWGPPKLYRRRKCKKYIDFSYSGLRQRGDDYWLHLERMGEKELGEEVINCFLNIKEFNCHIDNPGTDKGDKLVQNLKNAVDALPDAYAALAGCTIENVDFRQKSIRSRIDQIYFCLCAIDPDFPTFVRKVPATKLMHMALPALFVMWDNDIIKSYDVPLMGDTPFYSAFLMLMQENIRHIRETNPKGTDMTSQELARQINKQCGYDSLAMPRLLDIANYAVSRKGSGIQKCSKCIEVTNRRLETVEWYDERFKPGLFRILGRAPVGG